MDNNITLTITPSNQEDFMNSLARKVVERGIDDEIILGAVESVKDNIDYDDIRETALEDLDVREIRQEVLNDIDYSDLVVGVLEEVDMYSLASDVTDYMDAGDIVDRLDIEGSVNEMIKNTLTDHLENYEHRIKDLQGEIDDLHQALSNSNNKIATLEKNAKRSFFSRIFG